MAGAYSALVFTREEVLGFLDNDNDPDEPICDGSDDDLGMLEPDDSSDDSDLEGQRLGQGLHSNVIHVDCTESS